MACAWETITYTTTEGSTETVHAIVCPPRRKSPTRCSVCQRTRDITLCDFPLTGPKNGQTCSRPVCRFHAQHVEPDFDYCPAHARVLADATAERSLPC